MKVFLAVLSLALVACAQEFDQLPVPGFNAPLIRLERSPQRYQGGNRPHNGPGGIRPGNHQEGPGGANGFDQGEDQPLLRVRRQSYPGRHHEYNHPGGNNYKQPGGFQPSGSASATNAKAQGFQSGKFDSNSISITGPNGQRIPYNG